MKWNEVQSNGSSQTLLRRVNALIMRMTTIVVIYQKLHIDGIVKFNSSSLNWLILRTVSHWIHLFLVLETIWSFLGHV